MRALEDIVGLGQLVQRLAAADRKFRVFGSKQHLYRLGRVLSEAKLRAFESAHGIRLPEDYRCFLANVGHRGAGPFYGLEPLRASGRNLSKPFPLTEAGEGLREDAFWDRGEGYHGLLKICHQGCGIYLCLVVSGPTFGTIWEAREDFYPTGLSFAAWYRHWAERALRALENERLVPRLRVGMSRAEVLTEVGGDWQSRQAVNRPISYLEAPDIPAQLELDEQGIVVNVRPWPFI